ncbi:MAG: capsular polysaccharide synthesis protein, partial [Gemmatimonadetes bacterium]|nr:capsular polysaccharide synthesis protein [Gemmatimonadota bacterium]
MTIPRRFHFVFGLKPQTEPFHLSHYLCLVSCLEVNRPERVTLYYHYEPYGRWWDLVRERIELVHVDLPDVVEGFEYDDAVVDRYRYAHHSDFVRIEQLIRHGGVYADIDTLFVSPLADHLFEKRVVMGREDPMFDERTGSTRSSVCNAFIMAEAGSPFLTELLERMPEALDGSWSAHSCFLIDDMAQEQPDSIHLEEPRSFYPFMWNREDLARLFEGCERDLDGVYSVHLWSHLWWERSRRDFSRFHA